MSLGLSKLNKSKESKEITISLSTFAIVNEIEAQSGESGLEFIRRAKSFGRHWTDPSFVHILYA
jgi:hypothetical protein